MDEKLKEKIDVFAKFILCEYIPGVGFVYINSLDERLNKTEGTKIDFGIMRRIKKFLHFLVCCFIPGMGFLYIRSIEKRIEKLEREKNGNG